MEEVNGPIHFIHAFNVLPKSAQFVPYLRVATRPMLHLGRHTVVIPIFIL